MEVIDAAYHALGGCFVGISRVRIDVPFIEGTLTMSHQFHLDACEFESRNPQSVDQRRQKSLEFTFELRSHGTEIIQTDGKATSGVNDSVPNGCGDEFGFVEKHIIQQTRDQHVVE